MVPAKKGGKKEGRSAINEGSDQGIYHRHSQVHPWSGFQEACPWGTQRDLEICHVVDGNSRCTHFTRLNKIIWAKGIRNILYCIHVWLFRKCNEDEDSTNKLCVLVTYELVTIFKKYADS